MNYEKLLEKYMMHVGDCEGIVFVSESDMKYANKEIGFTKEEKEYLINLPKRLFGGK